ncbi:metallophosphoesterase [Desulfoluna spongiiphila]|uniref:Calcineurin-like phosphoesterase n=1 Tax=Desulfoluna spongiiphila TaxID=419481 RepID=A0A1G5E1M6_9BACT|nr:metallophosphoesterase [Desulfoluna spongiiphila]SCY20874.1 Calcineurin-like phosphoesterase [Desulfoluna spongiiphila]
MTFEKNKEINKDQSDITQFAKCDAVILYPSLGCPALVKIEQENAWVEMIIASKTDDLRKTEVAFHLRFAEWKDCHGGKGQYEQLDMYKVYFQQNDEADIDKDLIRISELYENIDDRISVEEVAKDGFKLQLSHMNAFPWVLERYRKKKYKYLYKIGINLKNEPKFYIPGKLVNFFWLEREMNELSKEKPRLMEIKSGWTKGIFNKQKETFKTRVSEFGKGVDGDAEILANTYHPVYVSDKKRLDIGHITDIHLDTRMELYSKSVASVIEVSENCQVRIEGGKRAVSNQEFYKPLKDAVANFNELFLNISGKLLDKADVLVITGDLIDYNKGIHTDQTFKEKDKKPSEVWAELKANLFKSDNKNHFDDRNWFLFYKLLLELYKYYEKPVFTTLGNHDYVKHAMAPWPLFGKAWNGVYDMNLTRYENALCFGKGYSDDKEFVYNVKTSVNCVKWYTFFINPFPDYVVVYGDQSMFMVDWGEAASFPPKGIAAAMYVPVRSQGTLHHASNLFKEKNDFEPVVTITDENGKKKKQTYIDEDGNEKDLINPYTKKKMPFLIKNYTIYKSWINQPAAVKMLFTHATAICPRDDVSVGEINNEYLWKSPELCFGSFDSRRDEILKDVEDGKLNVVVGGHSHRNLVMKVGEKEKDHVTVLAAGERIRTEFIEPEQIVMVTSSGGPFPKYLPGAPMICACYKENKYSTGFYCERDLSLKKLHIKQLYSGQDDSKKEPINSNKCPHCHMPAGDMVRKPARRHRPGGNLLTFDDTGKLKIQSVVADDKKNKPRKAVMCEEQKVFVDDMQLEHINSYKEYNKWDERTKSIRIISAEPFTYYGYMEFPSRVKYITYKAGSLSGDSAVELISTEHSNKFIKFVQESVFNNIYEKRVVQSIIKDSFDTLFISAQNEKDFAFFRYSFGELDLWDRELNIGKKIREDIKEYAKVKTNNAFEASKGWLAETFDKTYDPEYQEYIEDDFRGMLLEFRTIPDFDKRKKTDVCGY